ncbi:MAG: HD domain-containing protein [Acidimicrobiales bacterium]|nr:HD domain-containing protein [Acidimicrobiales bacterium]
MTTVEALLAPYRGPAGNQPYDELVTETEHALQCADLAIDDGATDALIVAALFHDIGHVIDPADEHHELTGARYLRRRFGRDVAGPVGLHVEAKRYLVAVDPDYAGKLSVGSVASLELQGGPLPRHCVRSFEAARHWADAVALRRWDDAAKEPGRPTRTLEDHVDRIHAMLRQARVTP